LAFWDKRVGIKTKKVMVMDIILKYFPDLTESQIKQFASLQELYADWNAQINVISRKDIESLYEKHVLHSLAIAKFIQFTQFILNICIIIKRQYIRRTLLKIMLL
jgi:flagellar basal body-associated protein FliL